MTIVEPVTILNFSHPLTPRQIGQLEDLCKQPVEKVADLQKHLDDRVSFTDQLPELMDQIPLNADELQTKPVLVVPPALNFLAVMVISDLHGRMGYFPSIIRIRPVKDSLPPRYEIAEILNLQEIRNSARKKREE